MDKKDIINYVKLHGGFPPYKKRSTAYQTFEVGGEIINGHRECISRFSQMEVPTDMSGLRVLDIGCNVGGVSHECKKRNANLVVGIDIESEYIKCAKMIADYDNLNITYTVADVHHPKEFIKLMKTYSDYFDWIFCLSVLGGPKRNWVQPKELVKVLNAISFANLALEFCNRSTKNDMNYAKKFATRYKLLFSSIKYLGKCVDTESRSVWIVKK